MKAQPDAVGPVKLFVVTLHSDLQILDQAIDRMKASWGEVDYVSPDYAFDCTDYYEKEMGAGLSRRFYSFRMLIRPDRVVDAKLESNRIEDALAGPGGRRVNLDPGYVDYYKLVLASMKFGGQKLYLRDGVYGDMTLVMNRGRWEAFDWGFPDFKSRRYDDVLNRIRDIYKQQMRATKP